MKRVNSILRWCFVWAAAVASPAAAAELSQQDVQRIARHVGDWGLAETPAFARDRVSEQLERVLGEARTYFTGRALDVAEHFVKHPDSAAQNTGYFFVLRAVGDPPAALFLIRALSDPPKQETGKWPRDGSEIRIALEAVLGSEHAKGNAEVAAALADSIARERQKPQGGDTATPIALLGKCGGAHAQSILENLASDPAAPIRAAAAAALGDMGAGPAQGSAAALGRVLLGDPSAQARKEAAAALGKAGSAESIELLARALRAENSPEVVDAIAAGLHQLQALPSDPELCREAAGRCWEASAARPLFECWAQAATRDQILEAAGGAPPVLRALALGALAPAQPAARGLVRFRVSTAPPPPPAAGGGSRPTTAVIPPPQPDMAPEAPRFDPATRDRLLRSAAEVLSRDVVAFAKAGAISYTTVRTVRDAFWEISGRDIAVALEYADRINPLSTRYGGSGRFGASADLARRDAAGYAAYRRPRQLLAIALAALPALAAATWRRARRGAVLYLAALALWGAWTLLQTSVRELPPAPLQFLSAGGIAFLSAGLVSALGTLVASRRPLGAIGKALATPVAAAGAALVVCGLARSAHWFPIGSEGWELIFEPIGSAVLAGAAAFCLAVAGLILERFRTAE